MTALPPKRGRQRSNILRAPRREWPRHRRFVKNHRCCVPGCQGGPIVFAHWRSAANAGTGIKPADWHGISLCDAHHKEQHQIGQPKFEARHGISMFDLAAAFARGSTDKEMKEAMKEFAE